MSKKVISAKTMQRFFEESAAKKPLKEIVKRAKKYFENSGDKKQYVERSDMATLLRSCSTEVLSEGLQHGDVSYKLEVRHERIHFIHVAESPWWKEQLSTVAK